MSDYNTLYLLRQSDFEVNLVHSRLVSTSVVPGSQQDFQFLTNVLNVMNQTGSLSVKNAELLQKAIDNALEQVLVICVKDGNTTPVPPPALPAGPQPAGPTYGAACCLLQHSTVPHD
ncbi:hypothetical protein Moror_5091 [Moniliophthora roreri MCA 2997]|uniref:Uncharacterized protein n=2 Tax=Moniliophthora roreri TaxID=221103 RepID=V2WMW7_MONRO|nr:hypothetical protein Moror_5091 [Moniliophthora roreri MCA 2997]